MSSVGPRGLPDAPPPPSHWRGDCSYFWLIVTLVLLARGSPRGETGSGALRTPPIYIRPQETWYSPYRIATPQLSQSWTAEHHHHQPFRFLPAARCSAFRHLTSTLLLLFLPPPRCCRRRPLDYNYGCPHVDDLPLPPLTHASRTRSFCDTPSLNAGAGRPPTTLVTNSLSFVTTSGSITFPTLAPPIKLLSLASTPINIPNPPSGCSLILITFPPEFRSRPSGSLITANSVYTNTSGCGPPSLSTSLMFGGAPVDQGKVHHHPPAARRSPFPVFRVSLKMPTRRGTKKTRRGETAAQMAASRQALYHAAGMSSLEDKDDSIALATSAPPPPSLGQKAAKSSHNTLIGWVLPAQAPPAPASPLKKHGSQGKQVMRGSPEAALSTPYPRRSSAITPGASVGSATSSDNGSEILSPPRAQQATRYRQYLNARLVEAGLPPSSMPSNLSLPFSDSPPWPQSLTYAQVLSPTRPAPMVAQGSPPHPIWVEVDPGYETPFKKTTLCCELMCMRHPPAVNGTLGNMFIDGAHSVQVGPKRGHVCILYRNDNEK